jgi:hypothetical protein
VAATAKLHRLFRSLCLACALLMPTRVMAGNDDGILIGSEAILTGGAVTATVSDGTAGWYNPAGLAQLRRSQINVNASTYGISRSTARRFFTLPDGTASGASVVDWQLVPSALSYAYRFGEQLVGSFGVFVPRTTDSDLRSAVTLADGTEWTFGVDDYRTEYAYIASLAGRVSETLRWGVSLHGVYISAESMTQFAVGKPAAPMDGALAYSNHRTTADYGLRVGVGLQWEPRAAWAFGLAVQTPTLTGFRVLRADAVSSGFSRADGSRFETDHQRGSEALWELSTPLFVRLGLAHALGRYRLLLDGSVSSALESSEQTFNRSWAGNVRAGLVMNLSERFSWGVGAFSDLRGTRGAGSDFVGGAAGVRFANNMPLRDGSPLTFVTTVGVRYAYGWGRIESIDLFSGSFSGRAGGVTIRSHEFAINVGSGISY